LTVVLLAANPCVRFHNQQRGYVRCTVTPSDWIADFVVMDRVTKPGGKASVRTTFTLRDGDPRPSQQDGMPKR
jgi:alkaline phosphatase D